MSNLNHGIDLTASEAHNYNTDQTYSDEALKPCRNWYQDALLIASGLDASAQDKVDGKAPMHRAPEIGHLKALVAKIRAQDEIITQQNSMIDQFRQILADRDRMVERMEQYFGEKSEVISK